MAHTRHEFKTTDPNLVLRLLSINVPRQTIQDLFSDGPVTVFSLPDFFGDTHEIVIT
jgi:hypothetical protein